MQTRNVPMPMAVEAALSRIVAATGAHDLYLFGSRARGDGDADSDWDIAVIVPDDTPPGRVTRQALRPLHRGTGIETHPMRRSVFERTRDQAGTLSRSIADDGIRLRLSSEKAAS